MELAVKELVESRCLEAMGDPAEIGREMARQYRGWGWLWLGRAAVALTAVLCLQAVLSLEFFYTWKYVWAYTLKSHRYPQTLSPHIGPSAPLCNVPSRLHFGRWF